MSLLINISQLHEEEVELAGELTPEELGFDFVDEVTHATKPLTYSLTAQLLDDAVLLRGDLKLVLDCECVRCLARISHPLHIEDWACHIPLSGEDKAPIIKDSVDLTPYIREDMVLRFPQHPLCRKDCPGLVSKDKKTSAPSATEKPDVPSAWDALNKLKL